MGPRTDAPHQQLSQGSQGGTGLIDFTLAGKLTVSLLHANNLVNICSMRQDKYSNPYCIMLVYPTAPQGDNNLVPRVWRTPTVVNNVKPKWEKEFPREEYSHDFMFNWLMTDKKKSISGIRTADRASSGGGSRAGSKSNERTGNLSGPLSVAKLNGVLGMLNHLESELSSVREEVVALHGRIDTYSQDGALVPKVAPPSLANIQPAPPNEEEQPEQGEDPPPDFLPGSVPPES